MHVLFFAAMMLAAPAAGKPVGIKRAIRTANRVAASATATWTHFDPKSDEYQTAIETVYQSGIFDRPVKVSVNNVVVQVDPSGTITVKGVCKGVNQDISKFYTRDELLWFTDFDSKSKEMDAEFKADLDYERRDREHRIRHSYPGTKDHLRYHLELLSQWVWDRKDEHKAKMKKRATNRQRIAADLGVYAEERKRKLETVHIQTTIPPALASTIDMQKLTTNKQVLLTVQVDRFGLREASDEIDYPVSIGNLSGETIAITRSFLKKTP